MSTNPTQQAKQMMNALSGLLEQAKNDPSIEIDIGEARKIKDALSNVIAAHDQKQQQGGKGGSQGGGQGGGQGGSPTGEEKKSY